MKEKFIAFCGWVETYWLFITAGLTIAWSLFLFVIGFSWLFGYWSNALWGTHFEINSCWQGITVVAAAIASIFALAKAGWTVYKTDSDVKISIGNKEDK